MLTLTLSETKNRLSAVIDEVQTRQERVEITRNGHPAAYLVSAEQMRELEDTAFWLAQPGILDAVAQAEQDLAAGRTYTQAEVAAWVAAGMPDEDE
ncbi:MAG: type II toxin-antitoxin system Phd/YefM family antitoxin [Propionibacteriaceae bacterium]|nr:type II toxin-antitoxin system Phd/YefM family antitoxin [Propionibacteriaceae bacterium]